MQRILEAIDGVGGFISRRQLYAWGVSADAIDVAAWYGRYVIRVRKGWYARAGEPDDVVRAWRVGGRLTCVSALAHHLGGPRGPVLHVEVTAQSCQLRDPDHANRRLSVDSAVIIHWTRHPGPGRLRAVTLQHAEAVAAACGTCGAGVPRDAGAVR